uniref:Thrombospondin n=1 Tax=Ixodes scapularis TaxID=6945 RepID=Q95WZ6_IXOSC|nr:thrombospondin [Ixodes scapularis]
MQLTLFIVIVTFTHLSCEVQSDSNPLISGKMEKLPQDCKDTLIQQMRNKCGESPFQTQLVEVKDCSFACGEWHNNGQTMGTSRQTTNLKDGTSCGYRKICVGGHCVQQCLVDFA